ncbi:MAG: 6,7-dimethyl-8-ribityllumazine synthase [Terriglobales bacterium]
MIKSVQFSRIAKSAAEFDALLDLFDALGFERGEGWQYSENRGVIFLAPWGEVEIGQGKGFSDAHLHLEVSDADALCTVARKRKLRIAQEIADTDWGARLFILEAAGGLRVSIFSRSANAKAREGKLDARGRRFGIVVSRFNSFITERLLQGALDALHRTGTRGQNIEIVRVPGSFEIPAAARALAESGRCDAVICLGCIIRGETTHYEHLANEVTRGIGQSAQETGVPHAYGVLTCDNLEQAIDRAGLKSGNKGFDAGLSAVEMTNLAGSRKPAAGGKASRAGSRGPAASGAAKKRPRRK